MGGAVPIFWCMRRSLIVTPLLLALCVPLPARADPFASRDAPLRVTTPDGKPLASGALHQVRTGDEVQTSLRFRFSDGRQVVEQAELTVAPKVIQHRWSWEEHQGGVLTRRYVINFDAGLANAMKRDDSGKAKTWTKAFRNAPGKLFAGLGFVYALAPLVPHLTQVDRKALGFIPKPEEADVQLRAGTDDARPRGVRDVIGATVHPNLSFIIKLVANPKDSYLWFDKQSGVFVQSLSPLVEPGDPVVRLTVGPDR